MIAGMNLVASIIARFGGVRPMAEKLDEAGYPVHWNTVQNWKRTGRLPPRQAEAVERAADFHKITLKPGEVDAAIRGRAA